MKAQLIQLFIDLAFKFLPFSVNLGLVHIADRQNAYLQNADLSLHRLDKKKRNLKSQNCMYILLGNP